MNSETNSSSLFKGGFGKVFSMESVLQYAVGDMICITDFISSRSSSEGRRENSSWDLPVIIDRPFIQFDKLLQMMDCQVDIARA
jgi:hypothetical protein